MPTRRQFSWNAFRFAAPFAAAALVTRQELEAQAAAPLIEAAKNADKGEVKKLVGKYFYPRDTLTTAMVHAISYHGWPSDDWPDAPPPPRDVSARRDIIESLVHAGAGVNATHSVTFNTGATYMDYTLLHLTALLGEVELAEYLLKPRSGKPAADPNARYTLTFAQNKTYILKPSVAAEAIEHDQAYVLQLLLDKGVDANALALDGSGFVKVGAGRLLHDALEGGGQNEFSQNPLIVQTLLQHGAKIDGTVDEFLETFTSLLPALKAQRNLPEKNPVMARFEESIQKILKLCETYSRGEKIPRLPHHPPAAHPIWLPKQQPARAFMWRLSSQTPLLASTPRIRQIMALDTGPA